MEYCAIWIVRNAPVTSVYLAHPSSSLLSPEHKPINADSWVIEYRQLQIYHEIVCNRPNNIFSAFKCLKPKIKLKHIKNSVGTAL